MHEVLLSEQTTCMDEDIMNAQQKVQACAAPLAKHIIACTTWCGATLEQGNPCPSEIEVLRPEGPGPMLC